MKINDQNILKQLRKGDIKSFESLFHQFHKGMSLYAISLLKNEMLAEEVVQTIRWHHEPDNADEKNQGLVMLCHVANFICNNQNIGDSGDTVAPAFFESVWKRLAICEDDMPDIIEKVKDEAVQSEVLLSLL
jgi:hypothetical protein